MIRLTVFAFLALIAVASARERRSLTEQVNKIKDYSILHRVHLDVKESLYLEDSAASYLRNVYKLKGESRRKFDRAYDKSFLKPCGRLAEFWALNMDLVRINRKEDLITELLAIETDCKEHYVDVEFRELVFKHYLKLVQEDG